MYQNVLDQIQHYQQSRIVTDRELAKQMKIGLSSFYRKKAKPETFTLKDFMNLKEFILHNVITLLIH